MRKLALFFVLVITFLATFTCGFTFAVADDSVSPIEPSVLTLPDLGNPSIAGNGSYYDDGMLCYASSSNTIGYRKDLTSSLVEFDIVFDYLKHPGCFGLTFRATELDRISKAGGYTFTMYPSGDVEVKGVSGVSGDYSGFSVGERYRIRVGAITEGTSVRLYFSVNGTEIINELTQTVLTGSWFNVCGEGDTKAKLYSTKKEIVPAYYTYTNSTIGGYPSATADGVVYDKYKNVTLTASRGTFGWWQGLQNFSFETKMNWSNFASGANIWVSLRANAFDRNNAITSGYVIKIGQTGNVSITKKGASISASGSWNYKANTDYIFEFGAVDLDESRTLVFVTINGKPVCSLTDTEPLQSKGYINFNGDGAVNCTFRSVSSKVNPLKTDVNAYQDYTEIITYFDNAVAYDSLVHEDFSTEIKDAIKVNGFSVNEFNETFYSVDGEEKTLALELKYQDNKLYINVKNTLYKVQGNATKTFVFCELELKKTGDGKGFVCPSGKFLKQTYYFVVQ